MDGLDVTSDSWLSDVSGVPCYAVIPAGSGNRRAGRPLRAAALITAKVDVNDVSHLHDLLQRGFLLVDTALVFRRPVRADWGPGQPALPRDTEIDSVREGEADAVTEIASSIFRWSRFHLDPRFPDPAANNIKAEWGRNLASGERGTGCLVARRHGRVVAFLGYRFDDTGVPVAVIDLVGVDPRVRNQGIGSALVASAITIARADRRDVIVGTQVANQASVRLYENLNFRLDSATYVLHGYTPTSESV